jgi:hypothetical protein
LDSEENALEVDRELFVDLILGHGFQRRGEADALPPTEKICASEIAKLLRNE